MKRTSGIGLILLCGLFFLFAPLSQTHANFEISEADIQAFIDYLICDYNVEILEAQLEAALDGLIDPEDIGCDPIEPELYASTTTTASFQWAASPNAIDYTVASIGLSGGAPFQDVTTNTKYTFTGLTPQQYLFVFIANCIDGPSLANVIIIDMDVYYPNETYTALSQCNCRQTAIPIPANPPCTFYPNAQTFAWNNGSCNARKYIFSLSGISSPSYPAEIWILNNTVGDQVNLSAFDCSDFMVEEDGVEGFMISDPNGDFQAILAADGAHFYVENPALTVSAELCDCFQNLVIGPPSSRLMAPENLEPAISPNPFDQAVNIETYQQEDGQVEISILDLNGCHMLQEQYMLSSGKQALSINTDRLPAGVYTLIYQQGAVRHIERMIKI